MRQCGQRMVHLSNVSGVFQARRNRPDRTGGDFEKHVSNCNGLAKNPIGYRYKRERETGLDRHVAG